jgi:hypothetical protein
MIEYENQDGEIISFELSDKGYYNTHSFMNRGLICEADSTEVILDCMDHEMAYVRLESQEHSFLISLQTMANKLNSDATQLGDYLVISREEVADYFVDEARFIVDQRSLDHSLSNCTSFYDFIELNGKSYQNVLGPDLNDGCPGYRYYVDKEHGLLAFSRSGGDLYVLK